MWCAGDALGGRRSRREATSRAPMEHAAGGRSRGREIAAVMSRVRLLGGSGRVRPGLAVAPGHAGAGRSVGGAPCVPLWPRACVRLVYIPMSERWEIISRLHAPCVSWHRSQSVPMRFRTLLRGVERKKPRVQASYRFPEPVSIHRKLLAFCKKSLLGISFWSN